VTTNLTPTGTSGIAPPGHVHAVEPARGSETRYERLARLIATDQVVMMDGATGTELIRVAGERPELEEHLWGLTALLEAPSDVKAVHQRYVDVGCDVICTDTWGLATAVREMLLAMEEPGPASTPQPH